MGIDRILFSVDHPFEQAADAVGWFRTLDLPESDLAQLAGGNARRLLGLSLQTVNVS